MDFTAYYTAGEIYSNQKNLYKNYIAEDFSLWDGVAVFNHSRFLYPPLVAKFFSAFSSLSYHQAKIIWNCINILLAIIILFIFIKTFRFNYSLNHILIYLIILFNFFPLLTLIERGQIDLYSFLFASLGVFFLIRKNSEFYSGVMFALSILVKLNMIYILPFLILFKKWKTFSSTLFSLLIIAALSIALTGYESNKKYIINELPRISEFAESGTDEMKIDHYMLKTYFQMAPEALSFKDGKLYLTEFISFNSKASLTYYAEAVFKLFGINLNRQFISLIFFLFLFSIIVLLKIQIDLNSPVLWMLVFLIILLSSPFTWVMNLVWIFPVGIYLVNKIQSDGIDNIIFLMIAGFVLISLPDNLWVTDRSVFKYFFKFKYVLGEVMIIISSLYLLKSESHKKITP